MKKTIRLISALVLAAVLLGALAGCATHTVTIAGQPYEISVGSSKYAIEVGEYKISANSYRRVMANLRNEYLSTVMVSESEGFWQTVSENGQTLSDAFAAEAQRQLIEEALFIDQFDRLGLKFTAAMEEQVQQTMREMVSAYGGMSALTAALERSNYTYDEYQESMRNQMKRRMVLDHYFKEYTPEKLDALYASENALIKHIYITKIDIETEQLLEKAELAEAKARAQEAYEAATRPSEEDLFDNLVKIYSDNVVSDEFSVVPNTGAAKEDFRKKVFALPIGGVALIEGEGEYLIVKRYDPLAAEYITEDIRYEYLESLCAEKITALLQQWAAEAEIEINLELTDQYRPEKMMEG